MIYKRHVPVRPLNLFVEHLWFYDEYTSSHTKEKLLPDGTMELIIDLREHPKHTYEPRTLQVDREYRQAWLSGMHHDYIVIESSPGSMMGVHFRPGGAWPFFGRPLSEFTDDVVELQDVLGSEASFLRERLLAAPTAELKFAILERFLLLRGGDRLYPDRAVHFAVEQMISMPMRLLIRDLAAKVGISQKHLINLFDQRVGMKPKQLDRVLRFQRVIQTLSTTKPKEVDWVEVAMECGYYDQAHFIHDFQAFSGMTPTGYLAQQWEYSNYVIVE
jgi:AraC-like DNA-binding protein